MNNMDIAIIGLSGSYPGASNLDQFWENLKDGRDCISEVPQERWNHDRYFDERKGIPGKTYGKWGGFLDGVDLFDPQFFGISPREAEMLDPQERLFLQCAYATIEDAGYTRQALNADGPTGVYVGVQYTEYTLYSTDAARLAALPASIANRVSFYCDFSGPSMTIDTMCSASATAIHLACQSLACGECSYAIAGGVNVSIHPHKYLLLAQGRFASSTGRCKAFGQGGDGYVPSEGVGAVLLKPLARAIADHDHIYGVIKATVINHGGRARGFTVPRSQAQAGAISTALKRADINPRSISYVEAHGTGTALGDLIEIDGLRKAFNEGQNQPDTQYCAIGSVKSNIGHCESAAGIAALTKVLLQMKHGQLVPSLHAGQLNRNIDFENTPFRVQRELSEWHRPAVCVDGVMVEYSRRAGISSFGAGGSNAHILLEEYVDEQIRPRATHDPITPAVIVLSARNEGALQHRAESLLSAIRQSRTRSHDYLHDLAFTLQVGREAMEERLGFVVRSVDELQEQLTTYLEQTPQISGLYRGRVLKREGNAAYLDENESTASRFVAEGKYDDALALWVKGVRLDWSQIQGGMARKRVSLPSYPFARERYWVPEGGASLPMPGGYKDTPATSSTMHPLLHRRSSSVPDTEFTSTFNGSEFFLDEHRIQTKRILPGVAYLEMAREAVVRFLGHQHTHDRIRLKSVTWIRPFINEGQPRDFHVRLRRENSGAIAFEFYTRDGVETNGSGDNKRVIHCTGLAEVIVDDEISRVSLDLEQLLLECRKDDVTAEECYRRFASMGLECGPALRGLHSIYTAPGKVLARINLPEFLHGTADAYFLHPCVMDSALQSSVAFEDDTQQATPSGAPSVPFALEEMTICGRPEKTMWALVKPAQNRGAGRTNGRVHKLDIDLFDATGAVCVQFRGYVSKRLNVADKQDRGLSSVVLTPAWTAASPVQEPVLPQWDQHWVVLCEIEDVRARVTAAMPQAEILCLSPGAQQADSVALDVRYISYAARLLELVQSIVRSNPRGRVLVQLVIDQTVAQAPFTGLFGLLRTAALEYPKVVVQLITIDTPDMLVAAVQEYAACAQHLSIRYNGERKRAHWQAMPSWDALSTPPIPWKRGGTYLITGGFGGLARVFSAEIAAQTEGANIVLLGRSPLGPEQRAQLAELAGTTANVEYLCADVCDHESLTGVIESIRTRFGTLNGILHTAGIKRDSYIIKKTRQELEQVLAPKVSGVLNLDQVSAELDLDFFVLFSSIAGALGNIGQADYAAANGFMDAFAEHRNHLVRTGQRSGHTLSVVWPLWKDGGMQLDASSTARLEQQTGLVPLRSTVGVRALYYALDHRCERIMVLQGRTSKFTQFYSELTDIPNLRNDAPAATVKSAEAVRDYQERLRNFVTHRIAEILTVNSSEIEGDMELTELGFDAAMLTELMNSVNHEFHLNLPLTAFVENPTPDRLVGYLIENHSTTVIAKYNQPDGPSTTEGEPYALTGGTIHHDDATDMAALHNTIIERQVQTNPQAADLGMPQQVRTSIALVVCRLLKIQSGTLDEEAEFENLGFDSITLAELAHAVNQLYQLDLSPIVFLEYGSVARLTEHLVSEYAVHLGKNPRVAGGPRASSAEHVQPRAEKIVPKVHGSARLLTLTMRSDQRTLYCIPAAGMKASSFQDLAESLGHISVKVLARQRLAGDPSQATDMDTLVHSYLEALTGDQPSGPYVLLGHSFGASVAFEMARKLEFTGHEVSLYMLDSPFYIPAGEHDPESLARYLEYFLNDQKLVRLLCDSALRDGHDVFPEVVKAIKDALMERADLYQDVTLRTLEEIARTYAAEILMTRDYSPSGVFSGRVRILVSAESILGGENLSRTKKRYAKYFATPIDIGSIPGGHVSMLHKDNVQSLAVELSDARQLWLPSTTTQAKKL